METQSPVAETLQYQAQQDILLERFLALWKEASPEFKRKFPITWYGDKGRGIIAMYYDHRRVCTIEEPIPTVTHVTWMRSHADLKNIEKIVIKLEKEKNAESAKQPAE